MHDRHAAALAERRHKVVAYAAAAALAVTVCARVEDGVAVCGGARAIAGKTERVSQPVGGVGGWWWWWWVVVQW